MHGKGTYTFANGTKYIGEYKDDKRHGQGTWTHADGSTYVGQFMDGQYNGLGKYTLANGTVGHDGEWENSQPKK